MPVPQGDITATTTWSLVANEQAEAVEEAVTVEAGAEENTSEEGDTEA